MSADGVSLKEHFEKLMAQRAETDQRALEAAHNDIERRLVQLNQLRDEVISDRNQFVKVEVFDLATREALARVDTYQKEDAAHKDRTNTRLTAIETRLVSYSAAIGFFFLIVQIALKVLPMFNVK